MKKILDSLEENIVFQLLATASVLIVPGAAGLAMMILGGGR